MAEEKKPTAEITGTKRVYDGFFKLDLHDIRVEKHEGGEHKLKRLVLERGHAVAILGYDPDRDEVLLINEMRAGPLAAGDDAFTDALPAGMIDEGETAIEAACREMKEETGAELKNPLVIHPGAYVSPGGTSERIALVAGLIDTSKAGGIHGHAQEGEDIKSVIIKADDFIARAQAGSLNDMKSLAAAFWLANNKGKLKKLSPADKNGPGLEP